MEVTAAEGGLEEASTALAEGGLDRLLDLAGLSLFDQIFPIVANGWTVAVIKRYSGAILTQARDKAVWVSISNTLHRAGTVHKWTGTQYLGGLIATLKLCGILLPSYPPPYDEDPASPLVAQTGDSDAGQGPDPSVHGASSHSSASTWMAPAEESALEHADAVKEILPCNLFVLNRTEQSSGTVPSLGPGHERTARHFRNERELSAVIKQMKMTHKFVNFDRADFVGQVERLCSFSSVSAKDKEDLRSCLKSYLQAYQIGSLQLNLLAALLTRAIDEVGDHAEEIVTDFILARDAPETWAIAEVMVAALAFTAEQCSVKLLNLITKAYAGSAQPAIVPHVENNFLVPIPVDEPTLLQKRKIETEMQTLRNPASSKRARNDGFSGRATTTSRGGGQRTRGSRGRAGPPRGVSVAPTYGPGARQRARAGALLPPIRWPNNQGPVGSSTFRQLHEWKRLFPDDIATSIVAGARVSILSGANYPRASTRSAGIAGRRSASRPRSKSSSSSARSASCRRRSGGRRGACTSRSRRPTGSSVPASTSSRATGSERSTCAMPTSSSPSHPT